MDTLPEEAHLADQRGGRSQGPKAYLPRAGERKGADLSEVPPFIQRIQRDERGGLAALLLSHVLTAERADVDGFWTISAQSIIHLTIFADTGTAYL